MYTRTILFLFFATCFCILAACGKNASGGQGVPTPNPELVIPGNAVRVALAGNAFITAGEGATIGESGLTKWNSEYALCAVYFKVQKAGTLNIALNLESAGCKIRVSVAGKDLELTADKNTFSDVIAGSVNIAQAGYVKVELQGISRASSHFAEVKQLILFGEAAANVVYANDADNYYWSRRGPSVHLSYNTPDDNIEWFYNEITVPEKGVAKGSFYMSNGFSDGYFGMQVRENEKWVLFSVWDPEQGTDKTMPVVGGEGVTLKGFGGEGTGGQSYFEFDWKAGNTYRFLTRGRPGENGSTLYSAWFFAEELGDWKFVATWKRPAATGNGYLKRNHSFLENFYDNNGWMGRTATYKNQWVCNTSGVWTEVVKATFTADATARNKQRLDYAGGVEGNSFFLTNGGFFNDAVQIDKALERAATGNKPNIDFTKLSNFN